MKSGAFSLCSLAVSLLAGIAESSTFLLSDLQAKQLKGVNLGGWLVIEHFIKPSLFADVGVTQHDEYSLMQALGSKAESYMEQHYSTFITEADFSTMKDMGIQVVRIPVGHYAFTTEAPYVSNSLPYLDKAFQWAADNDMWVLLDLHTAPGCQNPWDHSGQKGRHGWKTNASQYVPLTLQVIESIISRYATKPNLYGFGVLNEPFQVEQTILNDFYRQSYEIVRRYAPEIYILFFEGFGDSSWSRIVSWAQSLHNVVLDTHTYTAFGGIKTVEGSFQGSYNHGNHTLQLSRLLPVMVGEFSLAISDFNTPYDMNIHRQFTDEVYTAYWNIQKDSFKPVNAYFFWNYKLSDEATARLPEWSFLESTKRGWLDYLDGAQPATKKPTTAAPTTDEATTDKPTTNKPTKVSSTTAPISNAQAADSTPTKASAGNSMATISYFAQAAAAISIVYHMR